MSRCRLKAAWWSLALVVVAAPAFGQSPAVGSPPPITASIAEPPLWGDKDGLIYLRDSHDFVRLYPHAQLSLDGHLFHGARVNEVTEAAARVDLAPRFLVRHASFGLGGELLERVAFDASMDLVENPAIDGARADATHTKVALSSAWALLDAGGGFGLRLGFQPAPFSLENRTATTDLPLLERNLAIRGFATPGSGRVLGATIGGRTQHYTIRWDVGASAAESLSPGQLSRQPEGIARLSFRPWGASLTSALTDAQIGLSGRLGTRIKRDVHDDVPALTTGQGFALFRPEFSEVGETVHVMPSGIEGAIGGELRVPVHGFVFRSEAYYVSRATQEALGDERAWLPERRGHLQGVAWYAEASFWILQMLHLIEGTPPTFGEYPRADHLELAQLAPRSDRYGFELALMAAGINGEYDPIARSQAAAVPGRATRLEVYQLSAAANYWQTSRFRLGITWSTYHAPHAGTASNLVIMPGQLAVVPAPGAQNLHELTGRVSVMF